MTMPSRNVGEKLGLTFSLLAILVITALSASPVFAQVSGASLSGTIMDASGSAVPGAVITITDTGTTVTRNITSTSAGFYIAPNLLPGDYKLSVTAAGFSTQEVTGIKLTVGAEQVLDVKLQVGQITQKVEVTGEALNVELASSSISAQVTATTVRELPLNGRSWTDLATLQPGVNSIETQPSFASGSDRGNRGFGAQASISGARPQQNNYRLDGVSINDYSNGAPGSVLGGNLGVDAIQEFTVLTSNYSAEYGKTSGGVINAITRSGTNQFHGSAYEFLRNSALDARNPFDGPVIPPFRQNQFGVSGGGPIVKGNTFVFGDYEGIRESKGVTTSNVVPSANARNGILNYPDPTLFPTVAKNGYDCIGNGVTGNFNGHPFSQCTVPVDPAAQKYLPFFPQPTGTATTNGLGNTFTSAFAAQRVLSENFFTTRVDHKFSDKDSLFGTYVFDRTPYSLPDGFNEVLLSDLTFRQVGILEETHIFNPNFINTVRFGYNRNRVDNDLSSTAILPAAGDLSLGAVPGQAAAQVSIGGIAAFSGGIGGNPTYFFRWNSFQPSDDAFVTKGKHSLKFGFQAERMQMNVQSFSNPNGVFSFPDIGAFLTNTPSKFNSALASSLHDRAFRQSLYGAYFQDDWRFRPNLTLNLGLRYEMTTVMTETKGRLTNLVNPTDAVARTGPPLYKNPTLHNFEPRVGFAWDPFRNGKTAVRGGFGMFDVLPLPSQYFLMENLAAPYFLLGSTSNKGALKGTFYNNAFPLLNSPSSLRTAYIENDPHRNYVMQWNMNVQRAITPTLTATVGYVGSRGVHMPFRTDDLDMVLPTQTSAGYLWPCGPNGAAINPDPCAVGFLPTGTQAAPIKSAPLNPNFGSMRAMLYEGMSYYNSLQVQVIKNMSHGVQVQGAFTWAKSMDTGSATLAGDQFGNSIQSLDWFNLRLGRGLSDFNVGRTLVINAIWEVPGLKSSMAAANWATNGWQVGGIFKASDGIPFTPTFGTSGDVLGKKSSNTFDYPDRLGGSGCNTLVNPGNAANYIKTECFAVPTAPNQAFHDANCDPQLGTGLQCFNLRGNAGRNILIGPGLTDFDFSLFKNNYIRRVSETFNVQFRAELFNVLNHANFAPPPTPSNTDIFTPSGLPSGSVGVLAGTTTTSREIQFALKLMW
jgi:hypothetical protein